MEQRTFQIDDQWNIIYYPERPSGFSVMVIGDRSHFVEKTAAFGCSILVGCRYWNI
ncbi:hypothetical protein KEH51_27750 [[Brevibacterium] frigoritolerans]|uniref:Uncharacterized protein n=1 Tax=Peribacillus frigoritolerans TaxID=450367 RepID=A0A941J3R6_9BACI|nr:hypothetical protein [Peribacillus frigoritolerans]